MTVPQRAKRGGWAMAGGAVGGLLASSGLDAVLDTVEAAVNGTRRVWRRLRRT